MPRSRLTRGWPWRRQARSSPAVRATSPSTGSTPRPSPSADREIAGGVAALRAALGHDGLAQMGEHARLASSLLAAGQSRARPCAACWRGVTDHLQGDPEAARLRLEAAARRAAVPAPHVHALCLAQLALVALEEQDWEGAARLITRARSQVARYGLARYPTTALALAVSALVRAHRGRVEEARADATEASALLERLTDFVAGSSMARRHCSKPPIACSRRVSRPTW